MATERTLSILKPDALQSGVVGKILTKLEEAGLKPVAMKMRHLTQQEAEGFYAVHRERPFFRSLVQYMTSGPVIVQVLEGEDAVARNREVMGGTNLAARAGDITFAWKRSDGSVGPARTIHAARRGQAWRVHEQWELSATTRGWAQLWIQSERHGSAVARFRVYCK